MVFSSLTFVFLFIFLLFISYFIVRSIIYKNVVLLLFSLIFYSWTEPKYLLLMLLIVLISYIFGLVIDKTNDVKKRKYFLIVCVVLILSNLFIFKYFNFFINIFNISCNIKNIVLPIGISFYTFQILSYIIDLYYKKVNVQKNYFKLLLYISLFPQLIAGPIVRYKEVEKEINDRKTTVCDFTYGFKRFIYGFSKKIIIANNVGYICDYIYENYSGFGSNILWIASICYALQIYFDFSGYSDMAIGLGRIFGFKFSENFNHPYIADSITDFWRRWHISLSTWFKDYVYIPLGGSKKGVRRTIINLLIVWLLTGIWHGANYNFVLWGLYYGLLLILEKFVFKNIINKLPKVIKHIYTIFFVLIGWVIFRVENINDILNIIQKMFSFENSSITMLFKENFNIIYLVPYIFLGIILSFPIIKIFHNKVEKSNNVVLTVVEDFVLLIAFFYSIMILVSESYNPFIYFRF